MGTTPDFLFLEETLDFQVKSPKQYLASTLNPSAYLRAKLGSLRAQHPPGLPEDGDSGWRAQDGHPRSWRRTDTTWEKRGGSSEAQRGSECC